MAKKPKETEAVAERTTKMISPGALKSLLKSARDMKSDLDELTSTHSTEVREAVNKKGLHKKAFGVIKMLDRMSPEKLADFMEHFDYQYEVSGLEERAASASGKLPGTVRKPGEGDSEEQTDGGKKKTGATVTNIAEKAGANLN